MNVKHFPALLKETFAEWSSDNCLRLGCTGYALHPAPFQLVWAASRSSPILMMQAPEDRKGDDFGAIAA